MRVRSAATARIAVLFVASVALLAACGSDERSALVLWHSYRGDEEAALRRVIEAFRSARPDIPVEIVAVPHEAYANKIVSSVPRGNGPDVFLHAHERTGEWASVGLLSPLDDRLAQDALSGAPRRLVDAFRWGDRLWGVPIATKTLALFYRPSVLAGIADGPARTSDELLDHARRFTDRADGRWGLAWEATSLYFHSPWLFGFGGRLFDPQGWPELDNPGNRRSLEFLSALAGPDGLLPRDAGNSLISQLFMEGRALYVVNGPWFAAELDSTDFAVAPLPLVSETGAPAMPFVTVEGVFVSAQVREERFPMAVALVEFLAGDESSHIRDSIGGQIVVRSVSPDPEPGENPSTGVDADTALRRVFARSAEDGVPMPNVPEMSTLWEPMGTALRQVARGQSDPATALAEAQRRVTRLLAPPPPPANATAWSIGFGVVTLALVAFALVRARAANLVSRVAEARSAWIWVAPGVIAAVLLIFLPFGVGAALSLFSHYRGEFTFVGLSNFVRILSARDTGVFEPYSFWYTLAVTVLWTAANVALHVCIGLGLALLLRDPWVRLRGLWRVLLIVPWAVPNYITALIWKGMFHVELGAINRLLAFAGVEPIDWFSRFATAFTANLITNTWLGFPFMLVVSLGALQSVPRDLEEAAAMDGASGWQRFRLVTLPLLAPALLPAVLLGSVWTFNMFNIVFLVSGGEPDGSTEILISEAYRWAFTRQHQYGYAAAYGVLIFGVLALWSAATSRLGREG